MGLWDEACIVSSGVPDAAASGGVRDRSFALRSGLGRLRLLRGVRLQHKLANAVLCARIADGAQQREAAFLAVNRELTRGERDVLSHAVSSLPHSEPNQLQAVEFSAGEVQFGVGELALRNVACRYGGSSLLPSWSFSLIRPPLAGRFQFASERSVLAVRSRCQSQCCKLFSPTSTGSAVVNT